MSGRHNISDLHKFDRRHFLKLAAAAGLYPYRSASAAPNSILVNDVHSALNPTKMDAIKMVDSTEAVCQAITEARRSGKALSICGARHAAGGQQFLTDGILLDTTSLNKVLQLDEEAGLLTVQSGIRWQALLDALESMQKKDSKNPWGVNQKQTGLNSLTLGGTLGANAHGQGLLLKPFVGDIESFTLVKANGDSLKCSRSENKDLFGLVIGGYGIFGLVTEITLKLIPRQKLRRKVQRIDLSQLADLFQKSVDRGFRYGHCQVNINEGSPRFLQEGVFSTYEPVPLNSAVDTKIINQEDWQKIIDLVHTDKGSAFEQYVGSIESTNEHVDWADSWQNNFYLNGYHQAVDHNTHSKDSASEVLSEFYVPMTRLQTFLEKAGFYFKAHGQNVIFCSLRFIEKDDETLIPWARERYVCIVMNFHTVHNEVKIKETMDAWSHLIDLAIAESGSFYLTYQHVANKQQILSCYPNFEKFLEAKLEHDPGELFQSDWYRFYRKAFA